MEIKEKKKVTKILERTIKIKCDICKKDISNFKPGEEEKSRYFQVTTGHNDWGHDSIDSIMNYDVCPKCIKKFTQKFIEEVKGTEYIEIRTNYAHEEKYLDEEYEEEEED